MNFKGTYDLLSLLKMANVLENFFFSRGMDFKGNESARINFSPNRLVTDNFHDT